ncbi:MAG: hypothetical protein O8C66_10980 [Candidatus Methanoperedens sp.]|nr:hypothetical protein [Candidatus Methanoperedens sp.]MCZ7371022.1 hypothetical protein [Candidatus Methanoperedens sp.]
MKLTDDIMDRNLRISHLLSIPPGLAYGLFMGYLMIADANAAVLFGGIVLGCLVTGKINGIGHYFGLTGILAVLFMKGIKLSPLVFLIAALAALDETGDMMHVKKFTFIFDYRVILKLGILALVILNIAGINALLILLAFDLAYILTEMIGRKLA